jgi:hypothetical protein
MSERMADVQALDTAKRASVPLLLSPGEDAGKALVTERSAVSANHSQFAAESLAGRGEMDATGNVREKDRLSS